MTELSDLTTYHDLKKIVDRATFTRAMTYVAWHNRLAMTPLLELWQATVITLLFQKQEVSADRYHDVKDFLLFEGRQPPKTMGDCSALAIQLGKILVADHKK
jgi:hypothetical protein